MPKIELNFNPKTGTTWLHDKAEDLTPKDAYLISFYLKGHLTNATAYSSKVGWHIVGGFYNGLIISKNSPINVKPDKNHKIINNQLFKYHEPLIIKPNATIRKPKDPSSKKRAN